MKEFTGEFEFFDSIVKRSMQGNVLKFTFKMDENKTIEKKLIDFRGETVIITVNQKIPQESIAEITTFKSKVEVKEVKCRSSRNGESLFLIVEQAWDKGKEIEAVDLRFQDIVLNMVQSQPDLEFEEEEESGDLPLDINPDKILKRAEKKK